MTSFTTLAARGLLASPIDFAPSTSSDNELLLCPDENNFATQYDATVRAVESTPHLPVTLRFPSSSKVVSQIEVSQFFLTEDEIRKLLSDSSSAIMQSFPPPLEIPSATIASSATPALHLLP
ncbi:unnamed protein product [Peniophora sp. CBMAI 1063]|nr:unnamed protein product [Peniophora sp. CBMAI 1063]